MTPSPTGDDHPPRWAERLLRAVLAPADEETITGDLLEEYREVILPARGTSRARLWYLRQALSLVPASNSQGQWAIWITAVAAIVLAFVMRHQLHPGFPDGTWAALAIGAAATFSLRPSDASWLLRSSVAFGAILGAMFVGYGGPRGVLFLTSYAAVFITAGAHGAWRGHRVGTGTLTAIGAGIVGASLSAFAVPAHVPGVVNALINGLVHIRMFAMLGIVPGLLGALIGKGLRVMFAEPGAHARKLVPG